MTAVIPSHRLSRAKIALAPALELWYSGVTKERPSSIVWGR